MNNDYKDFLNETAKTSKALDKKVLKLISDELKPKKKYVLIKLITVHAFIGTLTMLFCPQFNMSLTNNFEVFHYFHHTFGAVICNIICGAIFLGSGAIFASSILSMSELKYVQSNSFFYYLSLSIFFVSSLFLFGAQAYLNGVLFWIAGAIISSSGIINLNLYIRRKLMVEV